MTEAGLRESELPFKVDWLGLEGKVRLRTYICVTVEARK
jgi:hypothetical protein